MRGQRTGQPSLNSRVSGSVPAPGCSEVSLSKTLNLVLVRAAYKEDRREDNERGDTAGSQMLK